VREVNIIKLKNGEIDHLNNGMKIKTGELVYILQHIRGEDTPSEHVKIIGLYSTQVNAEKAINLLRSKPGFCKSKKGFVISAYFLDKTFWVDGFVW